MTCAVCGKPQRRRHRHGQGAAIAYGRLKAEQERDLIRRLVKDARARLGG